MINVVIPMAGTGERFKCKTSIPKPFIKLDGIPMFVRSIESLNLGSVARFILIISKELAESVAKEIQLRGFLCDVIVADKKTEGPACTALLATDLIDDSTPLIIANCDQVLLMGKDFKDKCEDSISPFVVTFTGGEESKHSFVEFEKGNCNYFTEKEKISDIALTGIHYWDEGKKFVSSAIKMLIAQDKAPNGEYYISKSYNYLDGPIGILHTPPKAFYAIGTPEELEHYAKEQEVKIEY